MKKTFTFLAAFLPLAVHLGARSAPLPDASQLQQMAARFVPTEIAVDLAKLSPNDRKVLAKLVAASRIID